MGLPRELPEYCIWDFNGTILDDVETGILSVNRLLLERGLKTLKSKEATFCIFVLEKVRVKIYTKSRRR